MFITVNIKEKASIILYNITFLKSLLFNKYLLEIIELKKRFIIKLIFLNNKYLIL